MNFIYKLFGAIILLTIPLTISAQSSANENDLVEKILEKISESEIESPDYASLLDEISSLIQNPININSANAKDLEKLYFLNHNQIDQLLQYRTDNGDILSIYELQLISGFSMEVVRNIAPMITTKSQRKINPKSARKQLLLLRTEYSFEKEVGYNSSNENSKYLGTPWKYYSRYQYQSPKQGIEFGFTAENDKGEPFFIQQNSKGFDFYSAHFQRKSHGALKQINLGDFQLKFGQGVSLWMGMGNNKSSLTTQNSRKYQGVRSYKSTDENRFLRGASITITPYKDFELIAFASSKKNDASLKTESNSTFASSIVNTGLHRNQNEMSKKDAVKEKIFGAILNYNIKNIEFGVLYVQYSFNPGIKFDRKAHSLYNFMGKKNYNLSFAYQSQINKIHFFGEVAKSKSSGLGLLQGVNIQIHPQLNFELLYRKYDKDYHTHYSNAFSEQSQNRNEEGLYCGISFHPFPKWTVRAYYDQFEFPWLRYACNGPGNGHEYFSQLEYTPNESLSVYFRYKQENKFENASSDIINTPAEIQKQNYRLHLSAKPSTNWEIRNRIEFVHHQKLGQKESGLLLYQDFIYKFSQVPVKISLRYALFDTDSYESKIYAYENDILYAYSVPAHYNKGSRFYFNLNYKIGSKITLYARYAQSKYSNINSIGSGNSKINGDTKSDLKVQLKFRF